MKKHLVILSLSVLVLSTISCNKKDIEQKKNVSDKEVLSVEPFVAGNQASRLVTLPEGKTNKINISLPEGWLSMNRGLRSHSVVMLEYGDGYFTVDSSSLHTFVGDVSQMSYLIHGTTLYENPRRPPTRPSIISRYDSRGLLYSVSLAAESNTPQQFIEGRKKIKIIPSVNSVVAEDMITFACAYNAAELDNPVLEFYYNNDNNYNFLSFDEIKTNSTISCANGTRVAAIRHYNNAAAFNTGPGSNNNGFNNRVTFSLNNNPAEHIERNVFISLMPSAGLDPYWLSSVKVSAVLKDGNTVIDSALLNLPVPEGNVHDPNLLTILPQSEIPGSTTYKYIVDFENEGNGLVYRVKTKINLPLYTDENLLRSSLACRMGENNYRNVHINFERAGDQLYAEISAESFTPHTVLLWRQPENGGQKNKGFFSFLVKPVTGPYIAPPKTKAEIIFNSEEPVSTNSIAAYWLHLF